MLTLAVKTFFFINLILLICYLFMLVTILLFSILNLKIYCNLI